MVVLFVNENDFCYYKNCVYNHRYKFSSEKEQVNESQYIVSRPDSVRIRYSGRTRIRGVTAPPSSAMAGVGGVTPLTTLLSKGRGRTSTM